MTASLHCVRQARMDAIIGGCAANVGLGQECERAPSKGHSRHPNSRPLGVVETPERNGL